MTDWQCWECGKYAPGGVCLGPHPRFRWVTARASRHVEGPGTVIVRQVEQVVCSLCLRVMGQPGFASHMKLTHAAAPRARDSRSQAREEL